MNNSRDGLTILDKPPAAAPESTRTGISKALTGIKGLDQITDGGLPAGGQCEIEVIDPLVTPQLAAGDQIPAVPTLVRKIPEPIKKIIGGLSNEERVLVGLDVQHLPRAGR